MTPCVIGLEDSDARRQLAALGFDVRCVVCRPRRDVKGADSLRVIRQRRIGHNSIELTVSYFKTQAG